MAYWSSRAAARRPAPISPPVAVVSMADRLGGVEGLPEVDGGCLGDAGTVVADLDQDPVAVAGGAHGQPAVPMTGSAHGPILRPCPSPTGPTIATGLRGVPPGAGDDASRPTRTTPAPQIAPS